jgi:hypothetical protein
MSNKRANTVVEGLTTRLLSRSGVYTEILDSKQALAIEKRAKTSQPLGLRLNAGC